MESPHIIAITELRRNTSRVIDGPVARDVPVFVTQRGHVAAVILSRSVFDGLARREGRTDTSSPPLEDPGPSAVPGKAGIESFGPLPRGTLFETPWNLVDAETASFFMEEGIPVVPHLKRWMSGWADSAIGDGDGEAERRASRG